MMREWDWKVQSYEGQTFVLETVHLGEVSLDMELETIKRCGRRADIYPLSRHAKQLWDEGVYGFHGKVVSGVPPASASNSGESLGTE